LRQALKQLATDRAPGDMPIATVASSDGAAADGANAADGTLRVVDASMPDAAPDAAEGNSGCEQVAPSTASTSAMHLEQGVIPEAEMLDQPVSSGMLGAPVSATASVCNGADSNSAGASVAAKVEVPNGVPNAVAAAAGAPSGVSPVPNGVVKPELLGQGATVVASADAVLAPAPTLGAAAEPTSAASRPNSSSGAGGQQQQRLEVAAAAVLVHAASCRNPTCPVPHCNKMKKIHSHFLECNTTDCGICKKLKPLTYIHAKHCVAPPGEPCVIPYCSRAKKELQLLMQQRGQAANASALRVGESLMGGGSSGAALSGGAGIADGSTAAKPPGSSFLGFSSGSTSSESSGGTVQAQAHYLLVLAHVMKCTNPTCTVTECSPTKALVTNHTRSCRAGDTCTYPRCALSKRLMRHHRECPDQACPICLPLRRRLAAAKMGLPPSAPSANEDNSHKRKASKRKKDGDAEDGDGGSKRKRKGDSHQLNGHSKDSRESRSKKRGGGHSSAAEPQEMIIAAEVDVLESGFSVTVHYATTRRQSAEDAARGEWRPGTVMRAYSCPGDDEPVYDIMMLSGHEERAVQHNRCRMVCCQCLTDKRTFKPPPMFCEKCFTAIHTRWSYWEEGGDEGGVKLCKRCYSDIKSAAHPDRMLQDLAQGPVRSSLKIDSFVEKKERDRPEYVDNWVQCDECHNWLHWTCALYKGEDTPEDCLFFCDNCRHTRGKELPKELQVPTSEALPTTALGDELQEKLNKELADLGVTAEPVTIRVVSNIQSTSKISADHIKNVTKTMKENGKAAKEFPYRSKCILAFQRVSGAEICFFAMYVQEYGSDCPEPNTNRVYISYLDSVRYFESSPEGHRTTVYHSILVNYLDYAKTLGFTHAHIWVSPPKQGDDYIFYAHPEVMINKRMGLLKLKEWYEKMLDIAKRLGIVVDYQDMLEEYKDIESAADIPVFSGDHWAASIAIKMAELKTKEKELEKKKKGGSNGTAAACSSGADKAAVVDAKQEGHLLSQVQEEMRSMRNHFIVVTLLDLKKGQHKATIDDPVPLISNEFVDTRSNFLEKCQMYHWQFDEVRNAQHSTLMLLYYLHGMQKEAAARKKLLGTKGSDSPAVRQISAAGTVGSNSNDRMDCSASGGAGAAGVAGGCSSAMTTRGAASGGGGGVAKAAAPSTTSASDGVLEGGADASAAAVAPNSSAAPGDPMRSRSSKIEMAMADWTQLLNHANDAAATETWELPPEELFMRILAQINRSKRDILQEKYNQCRQPDTNAATRSVFIRVLKRIAESFMSCLHNMQSGRGPVPPSPAAAAAATSPAAVG